MPLRASELDRDPFVQFRSWSADAGIEHPDPVVLATCTADGRPSARMVLCRSSGPEGFVFFTDGGSRKGQELADNPRAALVFHWDDRQVRIEGTVQQVEDEASDANWRRRPIASRYSALASDQSSPVNSRDVLEQRIAELRQQHGDDPPRPEDWVGYRVLPIAFEFWQEGPDRLHDRFRYTLHGDAWRIQRLMP